MQLANLGNSLLCRYAEGKAPDDTLEDPLLMSEETASLPASADLCLWLGECEAP